MSLAKRLRQTIAKSEALERQRIRAEANLAAVAAQFSELAEAALDSPTLALGAVQELQILSVEELKERYGSYRHCRRLASQLGVRFATTPTWTQLAIALSHGLYLQQFWQDYCQQHPELAKLGVQFWLNGKPGVRSDRLAPQQLAAAQRLD
ncbi:hypothetical protein [Synechococcus elongatus]|uniref:hypothetical protein n=1 Tax=Synechococcus elongatus TaxID=32046 RepID=UPI0030D2BFDA